MGKISTRPSSEDHLEIEFCNALIAILENATGKPIEEIVDDLGDDKEMIESLDYLIMITDRLFSLAVSSSQRFLSDILRLTAENLALKLRHNELAATLNGILSVEYDEALDVAAGNLLDSLISSGVAEPTADGMGIAFDSRVSMSKSDAKPILQEAIESWLAEKL